MSGFSVHSGKIAVYPDDNVDTDRIIPARFLTRVSRSGYGELLFSDVRTPDFPLDRPEAKDASILVVGTNFGCGSSREHAVWAIQQAGFKAVIARKTPTSPGYSDIFRQNSANCGLLLIELNEFEHQKLVEAGSGSMVTVDLPSQIVTHQQDIFSFDISPTSKEAILKGLDLIGTTLQFEADIAKHEALSNVYVPEKTPAPR